MHYIMHIGLALALGPTHKNLWYNHSKNSTFVYVSTPLVIATGQEAWQRRTSGKESHAFIKLAVLLW